MCDLYAASTLGLADRFGQSDASRNLVFFEYQMLGHVVWRIAGTAKLLQQSVEIADARFQALECDYATTRLRCARKHGGRIVHRAMAARRTEVRPRGKGLHALRHRKSEP